MSRTPLYLACRLGRTDAVRLLLSCAELDMNAASEEVVLPEGEEGYRDMVAPIDICCWRGHTTTLKLLLEARADIGPRDASGGSVIAARAATFARGSPLTERQSRCVQLLQAEATAMALLAEEGLEGSPNNSGEWLRASNNVGGAAANGNGNSGKVKGGGGGKAASKRSKRKASRAATRRYC